MCCGEVDSAVRITWLFAVRVQEAWLPGGRVTEHLQQQTVGGVGPLAALRSKYKFVFVVPLTALCRKQKFVCVGPLAALRSK